MRRYLPCTVLAILLAILPAAANAAPITFTNGANLQCASRTLNTAESTVRWTCSLIPVTYSDGTSGYLNFYFDAKADGTFTGSIYRDGVQYATDWTGTFLGTQRAPGSLNGAFTGGTILLENFGLHQRGGYKGTKITVRYVVGGSGSYAL